mmetsp:Transcript_20111/g.40830  ORF Transcript_20111/g.40830 Transcript_20111/m.40830 type:complete len:354 (-) Transcript_20111:147-1208(-)
MVRRALSLTGAFCLLPSICAGDAVEDRINVLWVGNSLTFVEDLPNLFAKLAARAGVKVKHQKIAYPGWLLLQHAERGSDFRKLLDCNALEEAPGASWDYVVLQDDSQLPGGGRVYDQITFEHLGEGLAKTLPVLTSVFAPCIYGSLQGSRSRAVLYQTWGREHGDSQNPDVYPTFEAMTNLTVAGYGRYAERLRAKTRRPVLVARAGEARLRLKALHPECHSRMYGFDDNHPSLLGHYLDACIFLRTLRPHRRLPDWAPWRLAPADAALMRAVASGGAGRVGSSEAVCAAPEAPWSLLWWAPPAVGLAGALGSWHFWRRSGGLAGREAGRLSRSGISAGETSPTRMELLTAES